MIVNVLGVNQPKLLAFNDYCGYDLTLNDLAFLQFIQKASLFEDTLEHDGAIYTRIRLDTVQKALPILKIETQEQLVNYINNLSEAEVVDGIVSEENKDLYLCVNEVGEKILN